MDKQKIVAVVGPTASGKTSLAVSIAKKFDAEIISCDSMQIYKELSVSTAKPSLEEMDGVPHHLIGIKSVAEPFSVADFCLAAGRAVQDIAARGRLPIIAGGTGLYVDSFINNVDFSVTDRDEKIRAELEAELESEGAEHMLEKLRKIDSRAAEGLHYNNKKRVIRALEVYYTTGKTFTELQDEATKNSSPYRPLYIGINFADRQKLYERINRRVDIMIENGLEDEARKYFSLGVKSTASQAIGCKELKPYIDGILPLDVCIEKLKTESRRYAKRQITWFKRNQNINWLYPDEIGYDEAERRAAVLVENFIKGENVDFENQCV